jgi:hypothetical protein
VLAAGVSFKWWTVAAPALPVPSSMLLVMNYGIVTLVSFLSSTPSSGRGLWLIGIGAGDDV